MTRGTTDRYKPRHKICPTPNGLLTGFQIPLCDEKLLRCQGVSLWTLDWVVVYSQSSQIPERDGPKIRWGGMEDGKDCRVWCVGRLSSTRTQKLVQSSNHEITDRKGRNKLTSSNMVESLFFLVGGFGILYGSLEGRQSRR